MFPKIALNSYSIIVSEEPGVTEHNMACPSASFLV